MTKISLLLGCVFFWTSVVLIFIGLGPLALDAFLLSMICFVAPFVYEKKVKNN